MIFKKYPVSLEVSADWGMFGELSSGSDTRSYPLPPASACRGIFDSVYWQKGVLLEPIAVATCTKPEWVDITYNSHSPRRKPTTVKEGDACQLRETALISPRFQILALATNFPGKRPPDKYLTNNNAHAFQAQFFRRLLRGQSYWPVTLGRKENVATYVGPQITPVYTAYDEHLASMLYLCFDDYGRRNVVKRQNVSIVNGILRFSEEPVELRDGMLVFSNQDYQDQIDYFWRLAQKKRLSA